MLLGKISILRSDVRVLILVISITSKCRISARGNGTCQLSSKVVDSTNSSPVGTIFDPDFDMYARKTTNCFVDPQKGGQVPRPGGKLKRLIEIINNY